MDININTDSNNEINIDVEASQGNADITLESQSRIIGSIGTTALYGPKGEDGFSPIANVSKSGNITTISITDANGTTTADITNGQDGVNGQDGAAATITVGTVTTGAAGSSATVVNSGTSSAAVFDFSIPQGAKGDTGSTGATGNGVSGVTKISTVGLVDNYRMAFTDGTYFDYPVTNGANGTGSVADVWVDGVSVLDGDTAKIDLTNYVTTNTAQDISGRKTFLGEKAIYFKQSATTNKLGFTLYNPSNSELGALEYRPSTINGNALLAINCPQTTGNYVGFRYWGTPAINIVAPKPTTAGDYYIATHITNGTNTVTANSTGTVDISSLISGGGTTMTYDSTTETLIFS